MNPRPPSAAVLNWLWLASTARRERVLIVTDSADGWTDAARRHFRDVEHRTCSVLASRLPLDDGSFDCVMLPGVVGCWERLSARGSPRARRAGIIGECRRILRAGGVLLLSGMNPQWYGGTPSAADLTLGGALERGGFEPIHEYFADPSDEMPRVIIPACRSAVIAYERQERTVRGRAPRLLAAMGLHAMIYPARLILAFA